VAVVLSFFPSAVGGHPAICTLSPSITHRSLRPLSLIVRIWSPSFPPLPLVRTIQPPPLLQLFLPCCLLRGVPSRPPVVSFLLFFMSCEHVLVILWCVWFRFFGSSPSFLSHRCVHSFFDVYRGSLFCVIPSAAVAAFCSLLHRFADPCHFFSF